jgi:hypothetical protein
VRIDRTAAPVVSDGEPIFRAQTNLDKARVPGNRLIHGVVKDFRRKVVQRRLIGPADEHAGPAPHRLQPFQHLDIFGGVFLTRARCAAEQIVHDVFPFSRYASRNQRFAASLPRKGRMKLGTTERITC